MRLANDIIIDAEASGFRAMKKEMMGELTRLEENLATVRADVEKATMMAQQSDLRLKDLHSQAEAELFAIGEEVKRLYLCLSLILLVFFLKMAKV